MSFESNFHCHPVSQEYCIFDSYNDLLSFKSFSPEIKLEWAPKCTQIRITSVTLPSLHELNLLPFKKSVSPKPVEILSPKAPSIKKIVWVDNNLSQKNNRWKVSPSQLEALNEALLKTQFPSTEERQKIARDLGLSPRTVQIWFQNKRQAKKYKNCDIV